ncbi:MAG: hypothetical protein IIZ73_09900, partial [Ruminococcus sp.]|nr:hypothetical protein [Ruminococcus sp.]
MKKVAKGIVRLRVFILILSVVLMVPSVIGVAKTHINYDILSYLPGDIETMKGQDIMLDEFGKGGFALVVVENMEPKDVAKLKKKFEKVPAVGEVLWYDDIADVSVPVEILPDDIYDVFNS